VFESLCGTWKLDDWQRISPDGKVDRPLGENAVGLLVYTPQGQMSVQLAAAGRPPIDSRDPLGGTPAEQAAAYSGYLAYFGRWTVPEPGTVTHLIDAALYPNWSGIEQVRPFTLDRPHLVLRTPPTPMPDGTVVVNQLSWTAVT